MTYRHELIGKRSLVEYAGQRFEGTIIDEGLSHIKVDINGNAKMLIKDGLVIREIDGKVVSIRGKDIRKRPHDRIK